MIKYHLKCKCGIKFESWFSSSEEYDRLDKKNMLSCQCGKSNKIYKQLMSPQISSKKEFNFISEARSIHYDKKNIRNIYGKATPEQTAELLDEGIDVNTIPWIKKTNS